jgi:hypothetical protein
MMHFASEPLAKERNPVPVSFQWMVLDIYGHSWA